MSGRKHTHDIASFVLKEISLVPEGDNPEAHVLIAKRRAPESGDALIAKLRADAPQLDAIVKALEATVDTSNPEAAGAVQFLKALGGTMTDIEKRLAGIETDLANITKERDDALARATAAEGEVAKLRGEVAAGASDDDIIKSIQDPAVRAIVEKSRNEAAAATAAIAKMAEERETASFIEKARGTKVGEPAEVGALLFRIAKGKTTAADADTLEAVLKAAGAAQSERLFRPKGSHGGTVTIAKEAGRESPALTELNKARDKIMEAKPTITKEAAFGEAMDRHPELYDQYLEEVGKR